MKWNKLTKQRERQKQKTNSNRLRVKCTVAQYWCGFCTISKWTFRVRSQVSGLRVQGDPWKLFTESWVQSWNLSCPTVSDRCRDVGLLLLSALRFVVLFCFPRLSSVYLRTMGCGSVWQGRYYTEPAVCFRSPSVLCWQILKWKPLSTTKKCTLAAWCQTAAVLSGASETVLYRWV